MGTLYVAYDSKHKIISVWNENPIRYERYPYFKLNKEDGELYVLYSIHKDYEPSVFNKYISFFFPKDKINIEYGAIRPISQEIFDRFI